jgi:RNA polymerase sigma factor (TIGR02999 family)
MVGLRARVKANTATQGQARDEPAKRILPGEARANDVFGVKLCPDDRDCLLIARQFATSRNMSEVTRILSAIEEGEPHAAEQLLPLVYDELRKLAAQRLSQEKPGQTLQATALVHEAYVRLVDAENAQRWNNRGHFFAAAAEAMRRILVEQARRKQADKRGGKGIRIPLDAADIGYTSPADEILDIDEALTRLAADDEQSARLIQLRYFAGLSIEEAAEVVGISRSTAYEHWSYARVRLKSLLGGG